MEGSVSRTHPVRVIERNLRKQLHPRLLLLLALHVQTGFGNAFIPAFPSYC